MTGIPYGRQELDEKDIEAVIEVLQSDFLTQGPMVARFEEAVANECGAGYAVAVNSATSALHLACLALGLGPGDYLWTSAITFVASANCARYCGADVDFVDIDSTTYNMSVPALKAKLEIARKNGQLPKIVIPVHLTGQPCDMEGISKLSAEYGFSIIEDASHAIGAQYKGEPVGNCKYSSITIFSFHPVKIITTGEGGMALTNDPALAARMARLRSHGITRDPAELSKPQDGPWYYEQLELGFNYRMTDIAAALGLSQLGKLREFIEKRNSLALSYANLLENSGFRAPEVAPWSRSAFHLYVIRVASSRHREIFERLRSNGVMANLHYLPVYKHPYYRELGYDESDFPNAENYYREAITIPLFPGLSRAQQEEIIAIIKAPFGHQTIF